MPALLSFILGIYLNEKFLCKPADIFQWKLAGLLHDFGYPIQIARDILEPFTTKINEINRKLNVSISDVHFKIIPDGLENLTNGINSFDLIQKCLDEWGLHINAKEEYNKRAYHAMTNICRFNILVIFLSIQISIFLWSRPITKPMS